MTDKHDYDVCLSFAGEDRAYVEAVAIRLQTNGVRCFYDGYEEAELWGRNLYDHLSEIYSKRSHYCVIFISKHYARKLWTNHERTAAQARAFEEAREYILPARFDSTEITGLQATVGYVSLVGRAPQDFADLITAKVRGVRSDSKPSRVPGTRLFPKVVFVALGALSILLVSWIVLKVFDRQLESLPFPGAGAEVIRYGDGTEIYDDRGLIVFPSAECDSLKSASREGIDRFAICQERNAANALLATSLEIERPGVGSWRFAAVAEARYERIFALFESSIVTTARRGSGAYLSFEVLQWNGDGYAGLTEWVDVALPNGELTFTDLNDDQIKEIVVVGVSVSGADLSEDYTYSVLAFDQMKLQFLPLDSRDPMVRKARRQLGLPLDSSYMVSSN